MTAVVFDELNLGLDHLHIHYRLDLLKALVKLFDVVLVGGPLRPHGPSSPGMLEHESGLAVALGGRVPSNGDGSDVLQGASRLT